MRVTIVYTDGNTATLDVAESSIAALAPRLEANKFLLASRRMPDPTMPAVYNHKPVIVRVDDINFIEEASDGWQ